MGSEHAGGANVPVGDGSIPTIKSTIAHPTRAAPGRRDGGEEIGSDGAWTEVEGWRRRRATTGESRVDRIGGE